MGNGGGLCQYVTYSKELILFYFIQDFQAPGRWGVPAVSPGGQAGGAV